MAITTTRQVRTDIQNTHSTSTQGWKRYLLGGERYGVLGGHAQAAQQQQSAGDGRQQRQQLTSRVLMPHHGEWWVPFAQRKPKNNEDPRLPTLARFRTQQRFGLHGSVTNILTSLIPWSDKIPDSSCGGRSIWAIQVCYFLIFVLVFSGATVVMAETAPPADGSGTPASSSSSKREEKYPANCAAEMGGVGGARVGSHKRHDAGPISEQPRNKRLAVGAPLSTRQRVLRSHCERELIFFPCSVS